jgi:hypothetical protein
MIPLFENEKLISGKVTDLFECKCEFCGNPFHTTKRQIMYAINCKRNSAKFCSQNCSHQYQILTKRHIVMCGNCGKEIIKTNYEIKNSKSTKNFCSRSCSITYNNTHKTKGTRISKLEKWIAIELIKKYPNIDFFFNDKTTINSELDIYIPELKLAFELNGIFHYEPIYGEDKLNQIQNNDNRKFQACLEQGIELCIIDTSKFINFKIDRAYTYFTIIDEIIRTKILL